MGADLPTPARKGQRPEARYAAAVLIALGALACRQAPAAPPDYLVVGVETAPTTLDPRSAVDAASAQITELLYRGLTAPAADGGIAPDLASAWEAAGPLAWRFHLGDALFHDGAPVTADDVVATYESLRSPAFRGLREGELEALDAVVAEDERTVLFRLREPSAAFLAGTTLGIVPRACARESRCAIGSGPFQLAAQDVDTVILVAAATADPRPRLPGIVFRAYPDGSARALGLARGSIDLAQNAVEPHLVPWLEQRGLAIASTRGTTFQYLGFNLRLTALADPRVRRAIAHAIDVEAIVQYLLAGLARPAGELLAPGHWAHSGLPAIAFDPARARDLLAEASALPLRLEYKTSTVETRRRVAEAIAGFLQDVGIDVAIRPLEWGALYGDVRRGNFELFSLAWVGVTDPDLYFGWLHSSMTPPRGNNRGGYASALVDRLTDAGRATPDRPLRREIYRRVALELHRELPFVPLWWADNVAVMTRNLGGFAPSPAGDLRGLAAAWWREAPRRRG